MTLLAIGIGVLIGLVIGGLGGGGGVLTVPALVFLLGASAHDAATASLVIVGIAALVGVPAHARSGNVRWRDGAIFGLVGTVAAVAGTTASRHLDQRILLLAFGGVIAVAAVLMLRDAGRQARSADSEPQVESAVPDPDTPAVTTPTNSTSGAEPGAVAVLERATSPASTDHGRAVLTQIALTTGGGLAVGLMTGLFGVGGGFLAVPVLVLVMRWPMTVAVGTSLLVIVINSGAALVARLGTDTFDWKLIVPVTAAAVVATLIGKVITDRVSSPVLGRVFAVMLILLAGYTATQSVLQLLG